MLTPAFELKQDVTFLTVIIKAPFAKVRPISRIFEPAHVILGEQGRLRQACANAYSHQNLGCLHTQSKEVVKGSDRKLDF